MTTMTNRTAPPHPDTTSNATRLLSAGTYLDPVYRKAVIRELLTHRFRVVAPSYGYDAVPVLAHALAAHNLRLHQVWVLTAGTVGVGILIVGGVLDYTSGALILLWLAWATMFLRRVAILQTLATHLAPPDNRRGFDGRFPTTSRLTPDLVHKIVTEQANDTVYYGGYKPFVGAGALVRSWSNAELLIGVPVKPVTPVDAAGTAGATGAFGQSLFSGHIPHQNGTADGTADRTGEPTPVERRPIIPFTADTITAKVAQRMCEELSGKPRPADKIQLLSVDRRRFARAVRTVDEATPRALYHDPDAHWREDYDADREYLCIRIGSWQQELVTTVFVGFDIKGTTLHTEFYTYVLAPVSEGFHLVDRLPATINGRLLWRIAWDVTRSAPGELLRLITNPLRERLPRRWGWRADTTRRVQIVQPVDTSEFKLGRYALTVVDHGALTSVREMATTNEFHHFFQETDAHKYMQIVERHLLQIVGDFLRDHQVDLFDHEANQTNILQQNFGANSNNNFGGAQSVGNRGNQTFGNQSGISRETRPA